MSRLKTTFHLTGVFSGHSEHLTFPTIPFLPTFLGQRRAGAAQSQWPYPGLISSLRASRVRLPLPRALPQPTPQQGHTHYLTASPPDQRGLAPALWDSVYVSKSLWHRVYELCECWSAWRRAGVSFPLLEIKTIHLQVVQEAAEKQQ